MSDWMGWWQLVLTFLAGALVVEGAQRVIARRRERGRGFLRRRGFGWRRRDGVPSAPAPVVSTPTTPYDELPPPPPLRRASASRSMTGLQAESELRFPRKAHTADLRIPRVSSEILDSGELQLLSPADQLSALSEVLAESSLAVTELGNHLPQEKTTIELSPAAPDPWTLQSDVTVWCSREDGIWFATADEGASSICLGTLSLGPAALPVTERNSMLRIKDESGSVAERRDLLDLAAPSPVARSKAEWQGRDTKGNASLLVVNEGGVVVAAEVAIGFDLGVPDEPRAVLDQLAKLLPSVAELVTTTDEGRSAVRALELLLLHDLPDVRARSLTVAFAKAGGALTVSRLHAVPTTPPDAETRPRRVDPDTKTYPSGTAQLRFDSVERAVTVVAES